MIKDVYMLKGQSSLRYDPAIHGSFEALLERGYRVYDPLSPGDEVCTDTHRNKPLVLPRRICMHGHTWWCSQAPKANWFPEAKYQEDRDFDRFYAKQFPR